MKISIIFLLIVIFLLVCLQGSLRAQDISIQSSAMGNLSFLRITDTKADLLSPITIRTGMNDEDFSEIAWRGLTMHYLQTAQPEIKEATAIRIDRRVFNSFCQRPVVDEQALVRRAWKEAFGIDVWYPYYRAKEVEGWVKKKMSVKIFKLKGEPILEKGLIMYSFKTAF